MNTFWVQVDLQQNGQHTRFFMNDCGGRDQVVRAVGQGGWRAYETPLPEVTAKLCAGLKPVYLDVGANTGYYSLLAAAAGASQVYAFEPVPAIRATLSANVAESGMQARIHVLELGVGEREGSFTLYMPDARHGLVETSASLNKDFRSHHSDAFEVRVTTLDRFAKEQVRQLEGQPLFMKIDVKTLEPQVLRGGARMIAQYRPIIAIEILPGNDTAFFEDFCLSHDYAHMWLRPDQDFAVAPGPIEASLQHRDHLLVPKEKLGKY
jgi:FkbM family methyltransferase